MPVTEVKKDLDARTMTVTARFDAPVDRVWELWADPRHLERWWGPPGYPATFQRHDLTPGGRAAYFMTGPDGGRYHGWWQFAEIEEPSRIRFEDGFADEEGKPNDEMPTSDVTVTLTESDGATTMTIETSYATREGLETVLEMGVEEGISQAINQIDGLLTETRA